MFFIKDEKRDVLEFLDFHDCDTLKIELFFGSKSRILQTNQRFISTVTMRLWARNVGLKKRIRKTFRVYERHFSMVYN